MASRYRQTKLCEPLAVVTNWLEAYRAARIDQMVGMYSSDAVIDCACGGDVAIYREDDIASFWQRRFIESPAPELVDLQIGAGDVVVTYLTSSGTVEALLDVGEDGLITGCSCGPVDNG
jgi:ketosteroid isomerase-like protein